MTKIFHQIRSQVKERSQSLDELIKLGSRILFPSDKNPRKIYSLHEPQVECISKGKARIRYEFGNKVGVRVTSKGNWIVGTMSFHGNPYDGSTLKASVAQVERITGVHVSLVGVDKGYRGSTYHPEGVKVIISGRKRLSDDLKRFIRARSKIEPIIGHLKADHRLGRNYLAGILGDKMNPILAAAAFNLRKIMRSFFLSFFIRWIFSQIHRQSRFVFA